MQVQEQTAWRCPSCGAMLMVPAEVVSQACSYCASKLVDAERAAVQVDRLAPFRIPKAAAEQRLRQHLASRWWAPQALRQAARKGQVQTERIQGVLVPFFAYAATCRSEYHAEVGVHWHRTKTVKRNGKTERQVERHTEWFALGGTAVYQLYDHLVSASVGLPNQEIKPLLPFDLGRAVRFDPRLVAGWRAEMPSRLREEVDREASREIRHHEVMRIKHEHLPGNDQRATDITCRVELDEVQLVLLPVWIAAYRYGDRVHRLLVNGQTGKCYGQAPVSTAKIVLTAVGVLIGVLVMLWLWGVLR